MKILIKNGRVINPATGLDEICDIAVEKYTILAIKNIAKNFSPDKTIDATGCIVSPGLVDLAARLREPGYEHGGMLQSELAAAVAGGVTSLVCMPDTSPVLDVPGLIEMLKFRAEKLHQSHVFPLGALTVKLQGEVLTEMVGLAQAGCVGFSQAEVPLANTQVLQRALQYASTFGYTVWLRPQDMHLGKGVAASGALATRMGLSGIPVAAETIALHTIFELVKATQAKVHICRISSAAGVALVRQAKADGLRVTCDVSINSLHLTDIDLGFYDSRARLNPPLRQQRDRDALRTALLDGTIDALVSDHTPVADDAKALPFAECEAGATGLELLLSLALKWQLDMADKALTLSKALATLTSQPAKIIADHVPGKYGTLGQLVEGGAADICIFDPKAQRLVTADTLRSQGKSTPFSGYELTGKVIATLVAGHVAFEA
jgi:dihydroorotase